MLKKSVLIATLILCISFSSCAVNSGNSKLEQIDDEKINSILIKGKTTQLEIKEAFGDPDDIDIMVDGKLKWIYSHIERSEMTRNYIPVLNWFSAGTYDTTRKLILVFKKNILIDFSLSIAKGKTKIGILRLI